MRLKSAIDPLQMIVDAVPDHIKETADRSYKERLQDEMDEYLTKHGEPDYDTTTLRNVIAKRLSKAPPGGPALHPTNAFAASAFDKKGNDDGGARAKRFDGKRVKGTAGKPMQGRGTPAAQGRPGIEGTWFCFIKSEEAGDIFCHSGDIAAGTMTEGCEVDFAISYDKRKGKDKATDVRVVASTAAVATESDEDETEYDASTHY